MATKAKIAARQRRKGIVARYAARRAELKEQVRTGTPEQREAARRGLSALPRDASPVRVRNRDAIDGRPRATSARQACRGFASASSRTQENCPGSPSRPGEPEPRRHLVAASSARRSRAGSPRRWRSVRSRPLTG